MTIRGKDNCSKGDRSIGERVTLLFLWKELNSTVIKFYKIEIYSEQNEDVSRFRNVER